MHIVEALEGPEKVALSGKYKTAATWYFQRVQDAIHPTKRRKVCNHAFRHMYYVADTKEKIGSPTCGTCGVTSARPFVCLHCPYSGCWAKGHIRGHLRHTGHFFCESSISRHPGTSCDLTIDLGTDPKTGRIFCSQCDNFILNTTFEDLFSAAVVRAEEAETRFQGTNIQTFLSMMRLKYRSYEEGSRNLPPLDAKRKRYRCAQRR
jgi:ubiquitin carboxyl-terminal hydrolase 22/27/51